MTSVEITPVMTAAVLTVSDSCVAGDRKDESGPAIIALLQGRLFNITASQVVCDDQQEIQRAIIHLATAARFVVTTGGTGIATRDVTPEATRAICERLIEGIPERMRFEGAKKTPFAALSRGLCGVCGKALVLNLPGSPRGAVESLNSVIDLVPHMLQLLEGITAH